MAERPAAEPPVYMTARQVKSLFGGISDMTLWRWLQDEALAFPKPTTICRRRYFLLAEIEEFRGRQLAKASPQQEPSRLGFAALEQRRADLQAEVDDLEKARGTQRTIQTLEPVIHALGASVLFREDEIVSVATPWATMSGVYFLISGARVVYVGQSINVFGRIGQHVSSGLNFSAVTVLAARREELDALESLYIHLLKPPLNGRRGRGAAKSAPVNVPELIRRITQDGEVAGHG